MVFERAASLQKSPRPDVDRRRFPGRATLRAPARRGAEVVATLPTKAGRTTSAKRAPPPKPLQRGRGRQEAKEPIRHDHDVLAAVGPAGRVEPFGGPPVGVKAAQPPAVRPLYRGVSP